MEKSESTVKKDDNGTEVVATQQNTTEIVEHAEHIPQEFDLDKVVRLAEAQVKALSKVFEIAIKRLETTDWCDQQGKPYLMASGCEKLMPLFGISILNIKSRKEKDKDEKGDYYIYYYSGTFQWKGNAIESMGACSSRDKFFAWDKYNKDFKPLHDVDETNIAKASYSNMVVRGVTGLLGIRNLNWDKLIALGVDRDKCAKVEYGKKNSTVRNISDAQKKRLFAISSSCKVSNDDVKKYMKETHKIESSKDITMGKQYEDIITWIESQKK